MAVKKKSVKKVSKTAKDSKEMSCDANNCRCNLAAMAFILFLITVWPWAMNLVHKVHWGWFLGATIVFCVLAKTKSSWCCKK